MANASINTNTDVDTGLESKLTNEMVLGKIKEFGGDAKAVIEWIIKEKVSDPKPELGKLLDNSLRTLKGTHSKKLKNRNKEEKCGNFDEDSYHWWAQQVFKFQPYLKTKPVARILRQLKYLKLLLDLNSL